MAAISFKKVKDSAKSSHQLVEVDGVPAGEVRREQVHAPDIKGKVTRKWRWFARLQGEAQTLGRGTRAAVIFGAGFVDKDRAVNELQSASAALAGSAGDERTLSL